MKSKLYRTHYQVNSNLGSQQASKKQGAISKTVTINAGKEPTSNNPKFHGSSLKLNSDHEDVTFPVTWCSLNLSQKGLMVSTLKNDWATWSKTEALLSKNNLYAHIIDKKIRFYFFFNSGCIIFHNACKKLPVPQLNMFREKGQRLKMSDFKCFFFNKINLNRIA